MTREEIETRFKKAVFDSLDLDSIEEVTPESEFVDDLGADSLNLVELLLYTEEEFEIDIDDEEAYSLRKVKDAVDFLVKKLEEKKLRK
jgi:acyl carrier protein